MLKRIFLLPAFSVVLSAVQAEDHWSYVPAKMPELSGTEHPIDQLLARAQQKVGIVSADLAPPRQWVERAAYTLLGLPATEEQIRKIEAQPDDATWRALIDEMLNSPAYGERWARHWMDVARYADTSGYAFEQDNRYPFAYTYRDWLVKAFNQDMPYPEFIKWQIAGDLMAPDKNHPDLAALGFLTVGPRNGGVETIDDRVDVVTRGFLASTVSCARCHKHKTDPITMNDYYSLYSIFENIEEPEDKPVIGVVADAAAQQGFQAEVEKWNQQDVAVREELVKHLHDPAAMAIYLELAWRMKQENWDQARASTESFKRGRYRPVAVERWRNFLQGKAWEGTASPRLQAWHQAMVAADDAGRAALCQALSQEWLAATGEAELAKFSQQDDCPLKYDVHRISQIFDREDDTKRRERVSALRKLEADHPGSPPRAMVVNDRPQWSDAQIFLRGNPATRGDKIERTWLSFLGGGAFPAGKSPRLSLAENIIDPNNPLTDRVIVNRLWAWQFGQAMVDTSDFGYQQDAPVLMEMLDYLAMTFRQKGSSIKEMHRLLMTSRAYRLSAAGPEKNRSIDEANQFVWKWNTRRVDFESMRDRLLWTAGSLALEQRGGRATGIEEPAMDKRRSLYAFVDRYALPTTFVSFDLPHPDHHSAKRVETIVPQQALYFLNGPLVMRQAAQLVAHPEFTACATDEAKAQWLYRRIYQRAATDKECQAMIEWLRAIDPQEYQPPLSGYWQIRHAPDQNGVAGPEQVFPLFADQTWKTGENLANAPIPWLSAGAGHGHPCQGHCLILRWRAAGSGQVKMTGQLDKAQEGGDVLAWEIVGKNHQVLRAGTLAPKQSLPLDSDWIDVAIGDVIDFQLRAPNGQNNGGTRWDLRVLGRENPAGAVREVGNLQKQFPVGEIAPPFPSKMNPWADLVQMLWASNEFHFID